MSHTLSRIAPDTKDYEADDQTWAGAKITGGRGNLLGEALLYTSETMALASLKTVVHLNSGLPFNRYLVSVLCPMIYGRRRSGKKSPPSRSAVMPSPAGESV